jgi:hypothetical protein
LEKLKPLGRLLAKELVDMPLTARRSPASRQAAGTLDEAGMRRHTQLAAHQLFIPMQEPARMAMGGMRAHV